jgi:hypothetical protein
MGFLSRLTTRFLRGVALVAALTIPSWAAATPVAAPAGGVFHTNVIVTLTAPAGEIRCTFDGSEPATNSALYSGPLVLTNSTLIKAAAFVAGAQAGATRTEAYSLLDTNVLAFDSSLPLIILDTFGRAIPTANGSWMFLFNTSTNGRATLAGSNEFAGPVKLKPRGYTSLRYPKRSLTMETLDAKGDDKKVPLLGMPAESDWVLYAPYPDKTLIRDVLAYELSNQLGRYAPRTRFVEVFINDSTGRVAQAQYAGLYVLEEKVKISPHRVAIDKLSGSHNAEPEISGGYLFKKDHLEKAMGEFPPDGPPRSRPPSVPWYLPTGPGAFPAAASGFLPTQMPAPLSNALSIVTNNVAVTNVVSATNVLVIAPPSVTVIKTNSSVLTNMVNVTNSVAVTNVVLATNTPIATNVAVTMQTNVVTNAVVAAQSVAGTNLVATTNAVDATTAVVTITTSITTTTTYRTNSVVATNVAALTNTSFVTNIVVLTNHVVATNAVVAAVPTYATNHFLVTNIFRIGPEISPLAEMLAQSGEGFITTQGNAFFLVDPKPTKITAAQRAWLTNYLNSLEAALYGPDFRNPTNGYAAFLDVDSFIDHHLFVEATKNIDGFRFSTFFNKPRGGKLKMEPIWDWNLSMGNAKGKQGYMHEHWYWPQLNDQQYSWFRRLFEDPDFGQRYVDRWAQWRTNVFATSNILARIDQLAASLKEPAARNFARWPVLGNQVGPEYFVGKTYEEEISYLKTWMSNRLAWIDAQFVPAPAVTPAVIATAAVNSIAFNAPTGQVFFTTDGSDPRQTNGQLSQAAKPYQEPVAVTNAATIVARARNTNGWSSPVSVKVLAKQ